MVNKVVTTVGRYGDYINEIQQSYELGFTPYRLHTNTGVFVTPIRVYDGHVQVLDDVAMMEVTTQQIATDTTGTKLIYFGTGDDDGGDMFS